MNNPDIPVVIVPYMKLLLKYRQQIVSLGLIPVIATIACLHFFPPVTVLGLGLAASLVGLTYAVLRYKSLNFFLLQGAIAITLCLVILLLTGNSLLPEDKISTTLEVLIMICSFVYLTIPEQFSHLQNRLGLKCDSSYRLEAKLIAFLTAAHLLAMACIDDYESVVTNIVAPLAIYLICLVVNAVGLRLAIEETLSWTVVRVAPIVDGRLLLSKPEEHATWDLPIVGKVKGSNRNGRKLAAKLMTEHFPQSEITPRLILRYSVGEADNRNSVNLFVCPIETTATPERNLFSFDEIRQNTTLFNKSLLKEIEQLEMAADIWTQYYKQNDKKSLTR